MKHGNTIIWLLLLLLTSISFILGERQAGGSLILGAAGLKFSMVAWRFMDLRYASLFWSGALAFLT